MDHKDIINRIKHEFDGIINFYKSDIASIRTGRATPALVEDLLVEIYDGKYSVKELATITAPEPKSLTILPWDKQTLSAIENTIRKSNLGLNPVVDSQQIRLNLPPLTEERRKEFIKILKQKTEESRIKIRRIREDFWDKIQKLEKDGQMREDDKFRAKEELQKLVDEHNKKIEGIEKKKEEELLTT